MVKVKFTPYNKEIDVLEGENLLEAIRKAGVFIDTPCNGSGSCGKCKVKITAGNVISEDSRHITEKEKKEGYVLACQCEVKEDISVEIPGTASSSMHGMKIEDFSSKREYEIFERAKNQILKCGMEFKTYVRKDYLELDFLI
ncbi:2Fe-2S iron-sulfur cluster-binding protein [Clostridium ljungdahlii]|uniref:2Fe-2S iron-sulfur cluster-binding protein n=1 Tax=Clostridium ljungdahlii TaxID=1538 RepID=UPI00386BC9B3